MDSREVPGSGVQCLDQGRSCLPGNDSHGRRSGHGDFPGQPWGAERPPACLPGSLAPVLTLPRSCAAQISCCLNFLIHQTPSACFLTPASGTWVCQLFILSPSFALSIPFSMSLAGPCTLVLGLHSLLHSFQSDFLSCNSNGAIPQNLLTGPTTFQVKPSPATSLWL